jgi:hypothetical protein
LSVADFTFDPGEPDNGRHPNVGWISVFDSNGNRLPYYCSGSLIAPRVFLTAGHCTKIFNDLVSSATGADLTVQVGFTNDFISAGDHINTISDISLVFEAEQVITNPDYDGNWQSKQPDRLDLGIVILRQAPPLPISNLPYQGELDDLKKAKTIKKLSFPSVGFGATDVIIPPDGQGNPWNFFQTGQYRYLGESSYSALHPAYLMLSINFATGDSGPCWGDSGGPVYLGSTNKIVAIVASGDMMCRATAATVRIDTKAARAFFATFENYGVVLP